MDELLRMGIEENEICLFFSGQVNDLNSAKINICKTLINFTNYRFSFAYAH